MKCPNCGFESNGKFCENCGSLLAQNGTQENTESVNGFEQTNQNTAPEPPSYEYNTENRTYGQPYQSNQQYGQQNYSDGFGQNQTQNSTSYGQQFTNSQNGYSGQQFSNVPNGKKPNSNKTAIIIVSIVSGIIILIIAITTILVCNFLPKFMDMADKYADKAFDAASSYISDEFKKETTVPTEDPDAYDKVDENTHLRYRESDNYDGIVITGAEYEFYESYINSDEKKFTINIPSELNGKKVVEVEYMTVYVPDKEITIVIPDTVKIIGSYAFCYSDDVVAVEIPNSVEVIDSGAFVGDSKLKKITVPDSVKEMDDCGLGFNTDDNYKKVKIQDFKMYCKKGSAAETYAKENGFSYEIIK